MIKSFNIYCFYFNLFVIDSSGCSLWRFYVAQIFTDSLDEVYVRKEFWNFWYYPRALSVDESERANTIQVRSTHLQFHIHDTTVWRKTWAQCGHSQIFLVVGKVMLQTSSRRVAEGKSKESWSRKINLMRFMMFIKKFSSSFSRLVFFECEVVTGCKAHTFSLNLAHVYFVVECEMVACLEWSGAFSLLKFVCGWWSWRRVKSRKRRFS